MKLLPTCIKYEVKRILCKLVTSNLRTTFSSHPFLEKRLHKNVLLFLCIIHPKYVKGQFSITLIFLYRKMVLFSIRSIKEIQFFLRKCIHPLHNVLFKTTIILIPT